ncbi:hypothetical protein [Allosphingosinicella sp.]|jgi:hypothetical protein|uniref:hypothetical protein n=1 Tax=Allosphingosinicella sp. TaxID=2823234 RepID=UPI002F1156E1
MQLIEILLPLRDHEGERFPQALFAEVREELIEHFGGLTAFTRSPAEGVWADQGSVERDEIVIFEVMAEWIDRSWWRTYRAGLERRFAQDEVVIRAREVERL